MYLNKYLKYKNKYLQLQLGGGRLDDILEDIEAIKLKLMKIINEPYRSIDFKPKSLFDDLQKKYDGKKKIFKYEFLEPIKLSELKADQVYYIPILNKPFEMVTCKSIEQSINITIPLLISVQFYVVKSTDYDSLSDKDNKYVFTINDSKLKELLVTKLINPTAVDIKKLYESKSFTDDELDTLLDELLISINIITEYVSNPIPLLHLLAIYEIYQDINNFFTKYKNKDIYGKKFKQDADIKLLWYTQT